jgi:hypothetical protein
VGTALLNTLAGTAATAYLVGKAITPETLRASALHSYDTAFLWSAIIFVIGAVVSGLVLAPGNLGSLVSGGATTESEGLAGSAATAPAMHA